MVTRTPKANAHSQIVDSYSGNCRPRSRPIGSSLAFCCMRHEGTLKSRKCQTIRAPGRGSDKKPGASSAGMIGKSAETPWPPAANVPQRPSSTEVLTLNLAMTTAEVTTGVTASVGVASAETLPTAGALSGLETLPGLETLLGFKTLGGTAAVKIIGAVLAPEEMEATGVRLHAGRWVAEGAALEA